MSNKADYSGKVFFRILICGLIAFLPLFSKMKLIKLPDAETEIFQNTEGYTLDTFLYCKEVYLGILAGILLLYLIFFLMDKKNRKKLNLRDFLFPGICIAVYSLFMIVSSCISNHRELTFLGAKSEFEGLLSILSCVILFVFGLMIMSRWNDAGSRKGMETVATVLCLLVGIAAVYELLYCSLIDTQWFKALIAPGRMSIFADDVSNTSFLGRAVITFDNPGYLGGFCALMLPLMFILAVEADSKHEMVLRLVTVALLAVALKGSDSKASIIATGICMLFLIIGLLVICARQSGFASMWRTPRVKSLLICMAIGLAGSVAAIVAVDLIRPHTTIQQSDEPLPVAISRGKFRLTRAETVEGGVAFTSDNKVLYVKVDSDKYAKQYELAQEGGTPNLFKCLIFEDESRTVIGNDEFGLTDSMLAERVRLGSMPARKLTDERYSMIDWAVEDGVLYADFGYDGVATFAIMSDGLKTFGQNGRLVDRIPQPAITGYEKFYPFATGRGYIWVQSLPAMKKSLVIGRGPGNYAFNITQGEIVGLLNTHGSVRLMITQPHNWYLQVWIEGGLPALLAMLALFIWYESNTLIYYFGRKTRSTVRIENAGLFTGLTAFMIVGMINESVVVVNPLFWLMLGISSQTFINKNAD